MAEAPLFAAIDGGVLRSSSNRYGIGKSVLSGSAEPCFLGFDDHDVLRKIILNAEEGLDQKLIHSLGGHLIRESGNHNTLMAARWEAKRIGKTEVLGQEDATLLLGPPVNAPVGCPPKTQISYVEAFEPGTLQGSLG
jgi:hypothetical protein